MRSPKQLTQNQKCGKMKHEKIFQKLKDDGTNKTIVALWETPTQENHRI